MANYTGPDPNRMLPGEPWTSDLALAAFEDPLAIVEGATGAPRVLLRSLERLDAGNEIRSRRDDSQQVLNSETYYSFDFIQYGSIRASFERTGGQGTKQDFGIRRVRNNVTTVLIQSGATTTITIDVDVLPGDRIDFFTSSSGSPGATRVRNARLSTSGGDLWPGSGARLEGNRNAT